jgi:CubicO group peptidase (beta-lactamase class C family)
MRRLSFMLAVAVSSLTVLVRADDLVLTRFGDYLEALRAQAGIPGLAAAIVGTTDVKWERAFGRQDVERAVAARADTPFHLDSSAQLIAAALVLRCVEEGRLSLDDRIDRFQSSSPDASATIRQVLSHTSAGADGLTFRYRPERLDALAAPISQCAGPSYRGPVAGLLDRLAMYDSVPGPDAGQLVPPADGITEPTRARYADILTRLATPYAVDAAGRPTASRHAALTITPAGGVVSTVRDLARFDLALKQGVLLRADTLALAWNGPLDRNGQSLPHGLGWFVQSYSGEPVVWQFGVGDNASSSIIVTLPRRGLTLILLANSQGLVRPFPLAAGDLTASPFGRLFLGLFVR